jgi:predicted aspartyl protease
LGTLVGGIDQRRRPLIRLKLSDRDVEILCLLDTGFNGELMIDKQNCAILGFDRRQDFSIVEFADGRVQRMQGAVGLVDWLGVARRVAILVSDGSHRSGPDDPIGLVGTGLLHPNLLLLDFQTGTVEIEAQS